MIESSGWTAGHWKTLALILVVVSALVSGVYAYWKISSPVQSAPVASVFTSYPIELGMKLNKTDFAVGERVNVELYLKNISNRSIVVAFSSAKEFDLIVRDYNGARVCVWSFWKYFTDGLVSALLHPNETLPYPLWWDQTYSSPDFLDRYGQQAPSGIYSAGGLTAPSFLAKYSDGDSAGVAGVLHTPEISIKLG